MNIRQSKEELDTSIKRCIVALACVFLLYLCSGCSTSPLPDGAFSAKISAPYPPTKLRANQKVLINVVVRNTGNVIWPEYEGSNDKYLLQVGDHWHGETNHVEVFDDGRTYLRNAVRPGEEVAFALLINAPTSPGVYTLALDMVQEKVAWFQEKGSETLKLKVMVE